jgi:hypothetical protein
MDFSSRRVITEEMASRIPSTPIPRRASVMKRPAKSPSSRAIPLRPHPGGGISALVRDGAIPANRRGPAPDRWRARWVEAALVIFLVMLAPWGGPCDRGSRRADPTTMRSAAIGGPASDSRPSSRGADPYAPPIELYPEILDDEEEGEGFEAGSLAGPSSPFTPPPPTSLGAMDGDRHHDHSGRSARSPFLRC